MNINKNNYEAFFLDYHEGSLSAEEVATLLLFIEQHPELKEAFEEFENITIDADTTLSFFANKSSLKKGISVVNQDDYFIGYVENTLNATDKKLVVEYLKQQPAAVSELEAYKKTILPTDYDIVFENKSKLKKTVMYSSQSEKSLVLTEEEYLLIATIENVLTKEEAPRTTNVAKTTEAKEHLALYQHAKLKADTSIVFENKEKLKRESRKVVALYYYVAAVAASITLLIGFFFIYNNSNSTNLAKTETKTTQYVSTKSANDESIPVTAIANNQENKVHYTKLAKRKHTSLLPINIDTAQSVMNHELADTATVQNNESLLPSLANKETLSQTQNQELIKKQEPVTIILNAPSLQAPTTKKEFIPLNELASEKIKEKLLDEETLLAQKQSGQLKKLNGWDIAQMLAKGVSKLSGRKLELKPHYNQDGSISSYAFSAGEFTMSKKL